MFSKSFEVVTHSSDFKPHAPILSSTGASCVAGSGEQTSVAGFDGAGNEFGLSSATCRGTDVLPACSSTVTRHTSYSAADGSCPRDVEDAGVSSGREHFRLRKRDKLLVLLEGENNLVYAGEITTIHVVSAMVFLEGRGVWVFLLAVVLVLVLSRAFLLLLRPGSVEMCHSPRCLYVACLHLNVSHMCLTLSHVC